MWPDFLEPVPGLWSRMKSRREEGEIAGSRLVKSIVIGQFARDYRAPGKLLSRSALGTLARRLAHPGREALKGSEDLPGKLAVELRDPMRVRKEGLESLFGEFGLNLYGLVGRPHNAELFEKRSGLIKRFPNVVSVGIRDGLKSAPERVERYDCADPERLDRQPSAPFKGASVDRCCCLDQGGTRRSLRSIGKISGEATAASISSLSSSSTIGLLIPLRALPLIRLLVCRLRLPAALVGLSRWFVVVPTRHSLRLRCFRINQTTVYAGIAVCACFLRGAGVLTIVTLRGSVPGGEVKAVATLAPSPRSGVQARMVGKRRTHAYWRWWRHWR